MPTVADPAAKVAASEAGVVPPYLVADPVPEPIYDVPNNAYPKPVKVRPASLCSGPNSPAVGRDPIDGNPVVYPYPVPCLAFLPNPAESVVYFVVNKAVLLLYYAIY